MRTLRFCILALLFPVPFTASLSAQARLPLTQDTYDIWRSILQPTLSADGRWAVYTLSPTVGDGDLVIRATSGEREIRVPRGSTGRPNQSVSGQAFNPQAARITRDSRYVLALTYPSQAALDSARARRPARGGGANAASQPQNSLAIVALVGGNITRIEKVRSFEVAEDGSRYVAYQVVEDSTANRSAPRDTSARPARRKDTGSKLVLRELATGAETTIEHVSSFAFSKDEKWLVYALAGADSLGVDGVYVRDLAAGTVVPLKQATGNYRSIAIDEAGAHVAFITDADQWGRDTVRYALYTASLAGAPVARGTRARATAGPQAATVAVAATAIPAGQQLNERARLAWVKTGGVLQFGISAVQPDSIPADSLADKAIVDLWHWRDTRPQPMQRLQANQDRNRQYTAVYHVATKQWRQVANDSLPMLQFSEDGRTAVATTGVPYELDAIAGDDANDVLVINTVTGATRRVATRINGNGQLSPAAKYVAWWTSVGWQLHDIAANRTVNVTGSIANVRFDREIHDTPSDPTPWGIAGWTKDDARVLIYDRYDIWEVDPTGRTAPRNMTEGAGRRDNITYRVQNLDAEQRFIDPAQPVLLRAFHNGTKEAGFARDRLGATTEPERIVMAAKSWPLIQKARDAEQYLVTRTDYREFPNLWTGASLTQLTQISDAMPEQSRYLWGNVQLVKWLNADGVPMEGLLYTPEGYDSTKAYPTLVYFYEQLSDGLYNYTRPAGRNIINPVVYTSLGYVVFMPNIHYTPGYPGPSAVKSIVPGVQMLIAKGIADPKRIGVGGQSWGGYQTAYLITQTNLFAAAVPNATVVNMTSAYGGIRWQTGVERAIVNYERGQSRIGGSLWEFPERYMENSPLFYLDRVTTPVLFMANDNDGAVPWYQGIEFFVAMRRLGKEAYMLNYNGDQHNPVKYANQKDVDRRMQEFFAHHLLGAPAPEWMRRGIPFLERGRDQVGR